MIARREGHDTRLPFLIRKLEQPVRCSAKLEGMTGLQALALQPGARAADVAFDERRLLYEALNAVDGLNNVRSLDDRFS
jgi:hypothetical protein